MRRKKIQNLKIEKPDRWDGLWRCAIFDIPEKQKSLRNALRAKLKELGFVQVQKSVWVCPYPCRDELKALADYYHLGNYLSLFEGKYLGQDHDLKKTFNL